MAKLRAAVKVSTTRNAVHVNSGHRVALAMGLAARVEFSLSELQTVPRGTEIAVEHLAKFLRPLTHRCTAARRLQTRNLSFVAQRA
jgi:hypothetical protein